MNAPRASAAFVVLSRNKELEGMVQSIKSIERHFNRWFHYPYVFLNDDEFNSTFKETIRKHVSAPVEFGLIEPEMWGFPDWVNKTQAKEAIDRQGDQGDEAIMYGGLESYHHMCRFYSGYVYASLWLGRWTVHLHNYPDHSNFYRHPLLQKYKWYWRLEPDITYFCDITYDPFIHMERHNKTYGWTIAVEEIRETIPNLFRYVSAFKRTRGIESKGLWEMFLQKPDPKKEAARAKAASLPPKDGLGTKNIPDVDPEAMEGETYNTCHFWSNFEIANMEWYRSKEYEDFFQMLERSGGFWQERVRISPMHKYLYFTQISSDISQWGDAPVHSLAAGVLLSRDQVHYFRDFGYRHTTIQHCPNNAPGMQLPRQPWLDPNADSPKQAKKDDDYWAKYDRPQENGVGCRCRCDRDVPYDNEVAEGSCFPQWADVIGGFV